MKTYLFAVLFTGLIPVSSFAKPTFDESIFQKAIESGNLAEVKKQISLGAKVNMEFDLDDGLTTPLVASVRSGQKEVTMFLLKKGANPNGAKNGYVPLIEAVNRNDFETVNELLKRKADINKFSEDKTPLMTAAKSYAELVKVLVKKGAKVDLQNKNGRTALMMAAEYGCAECAKALMDAKADPKKKDSEGKRAKDFVGEVAAKNELHRILGE